MIEVNYCIGETYCKSIEEIDKFLQNKSIVVITKSKRYNPEVYDENVLTEVSNIHYYELIP